jgi:aminopeptidase
MVDHTAFARQILDTCLGLKAGERVWIHTWDHTVDLASELAWECQARQCHVMVTVQHEDSWLRSLTRAPLEVVDALAPHKAAALKETDVYLFTLGPKRPIPWDDIPQDRRQSVSIWLDTRHDRSAFAAAWAEIACQRQVRMLGIEATLATPERARVLGLDYEEWQQVMFAGCMVDYAEVAQRGKTLAGVLSNAVSVRITASDGTDFAFSPAGRPASIPDVLVTGQQAAKGRVTYLPAGDVEVSADEDSANGTIVYNVPFLSPAGPINGLTLHINGGRIAEFTAESGADIFARYLQGGGDVDRFGFFGFGLNPALRHGFTQDDKVLGSVTLGFGDNEDKGGRNRADGRHWWGSIAGATVVIGGRLIMDRGTLLVQ